MTASYTENGAVNLICSSFMKLNIIYGFYGVPSCSTCNCTSCNCSAMNVTSTVRFECTGLTSCSFTVSNALFSDPCYSFLKTFIVIYFCSNSCPTRSTGMYQIFSTFSTYIQSQKSCATFFVSSCVLKLYNINLFRLCVVYREDQKLY